MAEECDALPVIAVEGLKKYFTVSGGYRRQRFAAVDDVSFVVKTNETVGLVGESGCGKTTVGNCILRLMDSDEGDIRFRGTRIGILPPSKFRIYRKHIQMVFQDPLTSFNPLYSIRGSMLEFARLAEGRGGDELVTGWLQRVGLSERHMGLRPGNLSGGQLQRAAIARALITNPEFVFLDEPTSALDMSIRGQIANLLLDLQDERHLSYLLVSHSLKVVKALAHQVIVMYLGQIVEKAPKAELFSNALHPYTIALHAASFKEDSTSMALRGEVTQPRTGSSGCRLAVRCPRAGEQCRHESPKLVEVTPGHHVRCWRWDRQ